MIRQLLGEQKQCERIAVIENGKEIRYSGLMQKAMLIERLLPRGEHEIVAIFLPNGSDYIASLFGVIHAGIIAFPLNVCLTEYEIHTLLKQASVNSIITATKFRRLFEECPKLNELSLDIIFVDQLNITTLNHVYAKGNIIMGMHSAAALRHEYDLSDKDERKPMLLLSTSGTDGHAKIVQLSEINVISSTLGYLDKARLDETGLEDIRYTLAVPFSSVYGIMIIIACLIRSLPIIVLDESFTLDALYLAAEKYKITHYEGSVTAILLMEQMAHRPIPYDIHTLKYFGFGGSAVSGSTIEKLIDAYPGMEFYQGYGMTEAAPQIAKHPHTKLVKTNSVGTAIIGVELFVEAEGQITSTPYTSGEIVIKGPNVMLGYLNNEIETSRVLKNGYLYTGDIGYLDDEGYLYISGRKKNIIVIRGFNVYPEEVEACIQNSMLSHDCFVYGQMDDYGEEIVCADVVPINKNVRADDIMMYCSTHLAQFKQPRKVTLCKSIEKGATGKTKRH